MQENYLNVKNNLLFVIVSITLLMSIGIVNARSLPDENQAIKKSSSTTSYVNGVPFSIDLTVTASVQGDEQLEQGIYVFKLKCAANSCGLERFSLNECTTKNGVTSFIPKVDSWNSWSGFLEAKQLSNTQLELVVFQAFEHLLPARIILTFDPKELPFKKLTSFEGSGFIDGRLWPDINTRIGYTGLHGDRNKLLDCPVFLPGIN